MAWIESHQSLATHRKTLALRRLLGLNLPETIGYLHLLWWWALDNAPDGDLSGIDPVDIASAMQWTGDGKVIVAALTKCGFIDENGQIHDWYQYAGKLFDYRIKNVLKQRRHREKVKLLASGDNGSNGGNGHSNGDVTVTSPLSNPTTVPYRTVPTKPTNQHDKEIYKEKNNNFNNFNNLENLKSKKILERYGVDVKPS